MRTKAHRGNEVFIATNLKLRVVKYEYICYFYFFYKATILQLNLTIQQRSSVGNSPPLRWTLFSNTGYDALENLFWKQLDKRWSPSLLTQRGKASHHRNYIHNTQEQKSRWYFYLSGLREGDRHIKIPLLKFVPSEPEIILKDIVWRSGGEFPTPKRCWIVRFNCNRAVLLIIYTKNDL